MSESSTSSMIRIAAIAGILGGVVWAAIPIVAALAFLGIEHRLIGLGGVARVGGLFRFAGLSVVGMATGVCGVYLRYRHTYQRFGEIGTALSLIGFVLLLPGSLISSGSRLATGSSLIPVLFFTGLGSIAVGGVILTIAFRRTGVVPAPLAIAYGAAMPGGGIIGGVIALYGVGNIAVVLGLMVPFGLASSALSGYVWWDVRT